MRNPKKVYELESNSTALVENLFLEASVMQPLYRGNTMSLFLKNVKYHV